jgi:hypothetical protein
MYNSIFKEKFMVLILTFYNLFGGSLNGNLSLIFPIFKLLYSSPNTFFKIQEPLNPIQKNA